MRPGDEFVYDWFPVAGDGDDRCAATAFALELVFDDGSTSARGAVDQHGTPLDAGAQAAAKTHWVDQWNRRIVDLGPFAGRTIETVTAVLHGGRGFLDSVAVRSAGLRPATLLGWIDTRRGTHASDRFSRGNNAPLVTVPHGGVFGIPMTDASAGNWPYRYHADRGDDARPALQAFATSHIPSPWIGDRGVFQLMPSPLREPDPGRAARALPFDRESEEAGPHRYAVTLDAGASRIDALLTASDFALGMRFAASDAPLSVIVDHLGEVRAATWTSDADGVRIDALLFDHEERPEHHVHVLRPPGEPHLSLEGGRLTGWVAFDAATVDARIGISTIDAAQARANLERAGSVDDMLAAAVRRWTERLAVLEVPGDLSADRMRSLAGSLGRLFSYPNAHAEPGPEGARYRSPVDGVVRPGEYSANNGFWDTYRTVWPLLALLTPDTVGDLADGFVQHFADAGWVARWSAPGPVDSMTGTTSDTVFAELAEAGVDFRLGEAYRSAL